MRALAHRRGRGQAARPFRAVRAGLTSGKHWQLLRAWPWRTHRPARLRCGRWRRSAGGQGWVAGFECLSSSTPGSKDASGAGARSCSLHAHARPHLAAQQHLREGAGQAARQVVDVQLHQLALLAHACLLAGRHRNAGGTSGGRRLGGSCGGRRGSPRCKRACWVLCRLCRCCGCLWATRRAAGGFENRSPATKGRRGHRAAVNWPVQAGQSSQRKHD